MNKNILYGLVFLVLFMALVLPDMLNPTKGIVFVFEESSLLLLFLLGVVLFRNLIAKIIRKLNQLFPWATAIKRRIFMEIILIVLASSIISFAIYLPSSFYFDKYGIPTFYQEIEEKQNEINAIDDGKTDLNDEWQFSDFMARIMEGSFFCLLLIFVVEEIYAYLNIQSQKKLELQTLLKEQAQLKASILKKQLDPHFMFNTLSVLSGLVYQDVDKSTQFIKELSNVYRYVLEQSEELVSTVEQEFEFLESYMYLLKIRFDNKIPITINIPPNRNDWLMPSMTIELLVENAVKHNIVDRERPLHLHFLIENNLLIVKNNFQKRNNFTASLGVGLSNLKKRLELLGVKNYSFGVVGNEYVAIVPLINPENV